MTVTPPTTSEVLGWLDTVDNSLKKLTTYLDMVFTDIESCPQTTVDYLCETAGDYASYLLEYAKVKILNGLGVQKKAAEDLMENYAALVEAIDAIESPTPDNIVGVVGSIITAIKLIYKNIIKPYENAVRFITELTSKIISISSSMQQVASYTPPKAPDINFNKFKITFNPFTIADVSASGTIPYPDPPALKPFPNPFSNTLGLVKSTKSTNISGGETNTSDIA